MVLPHGLVIAYALLMGLCVGSFLNVVVWRVPQGLSIRQPGSHCPACSTPLRWHQNIPLLSWAVQRGRCASCGCAISARYPALEAAGGAAFLAVALARPGLDMVPYCLAAAGMIALSAIDLEIYRLPDRVLFPTFVAAAAGFVLVALVQHRLGALAGAAGGALIGLAVLGAIHLAQPRGMGFGDVKLAALCGLVLGWRGLGYVAVGLFGAFLLGAVVGVALMGFGRAGRSSRLPFGPFLCVASLGVALYGAPVVDAVGRLYSRQ